MRNHIPTILYTRASKQLEESIEADLEKPDSERADATLREIFTKDKTPKEQPNQLP